MYMFKHELMEQVYFLYDNKIQQGIVIARKYSDRIENFIYYADGPQNEWIDKATGGAFTSIYIINHKGINRQFNECNLFKNDKELIDSLYVKGEN